MREIILTKGKVALIDDADHEFLSQWNWCAYVNRSGNWYARCSLYLGGGRKNSKRKTLHMHRLLLGLPDDPKIRTDHIDGNGLNNQRHNLRPATPTQNGANMRSRKNSASKYVGVSWKKGLNKWQAEVKHGKERYYAGVFHNEEEAAKARDIVAKKIYGEYAHLNF